MKAQYVVLKEILSFLIGVSMVISLSIILSSYLTPEIQKYALSKDAENLLLYIDLNLLDCYSSSLNVDGVNVSYRLSLPDKIIESLYRIRVIGREICFVPDKFAMEKCVNTSLPSHVSLSGNYFSGTDMLISFSKSGNFSATISNPI